MISTWLVRGPALGLLAVFFLVAVLDLWFELTNQPPVGAVVTRWVRRYPIYAAVLALLAGAVVGHLFWQG
jgi:uncharacterized integral membrane protein